MIKPQRHGEHGEEQQWIEEQWSSTRKLENYSTTPLLHDSSFLSPCLRGEYPGSNFKGHSPCDDVL